MKIIKTEALLLKKIKFSDSSNIVYFYTKEHGKVAVIAKGARQVKNQFHGYLEPLSHLQIIYHEKQFREVHTLTKVDLIHNFYIDVKDLRANAYGMTILEVVSKIVHDNEENVDLFKIIINMLSAIEQNPLRADIALILFMMGAIKLLGYHINLENCHYCGVQLDGFFYHESNPQPLCIDCIDKNTKEISKALVFWLKKADSIDLRKKISIQSEILESEKLIDFLINYASVYFDFKPKLHSLELISYLK